MPQPTAPAGRPYQLISGLLLGVALLIFAGYFIIYLRYTVSLVKFPFDYDQGEGFELNDVVLFSHGQWPYRSDESYPFYASNYPPLYHLWLVPFVWLFGPAYWYGRLFSFASTLVTAGVIGWVVHRASHDRPISAIAGLAYLASNYVYHIGPLFRQHISMVMFETIAIVILAPLGPVNSPKNFQRLFWGLACLLAAGFTKQLAYATVAISLVFVVLRGPKRGLIATVLFGALAASLFGLINIATGGQWWINIILANINEFIPGQMEGLFRQWYDLHLVLIWLAMLFAVMALYRLVRDRAWRSWTSDQSHLLYVMWLGSAVANSLLAGKWGAGESYFMTAISATCLCAGLLLAEWRKQSNSWPVAGQWATAVLVPALLIAQGGRLLHLPTQGRFFESAARFLNLPATAGAGAVPGHGVIGQAGVFIDSDGRVQYYDTQGYTQLGRPPNELDIQQGNRILAYTRAATGPVLTEEAAFSLLAGKDQVGNPTQLYNLAKNSMLNSSEFVAMIEARKFQIVVLKAEFYPQPVLQAIGQNYHAVETIPMNGFLYRVLKPDAR
jgi:hypothetical protein